MHLLFNQIENLLAELHGIPPGRRTALNARLKHFKRLGFPAGVNTGRGKAAKYDASAIVRLLLVFEFLQLGLPPEKSVDLIRAFKHEIVEAAGYASVYLLQIKDPNSTPVGTEGHVILFDPNCLNKLIDPDDDYRAFDSFFSCLRSELDDKLDEMGRRGAFIKTTSLIVEAAYILHKLMDIPLSDFGAALKRFADQNEWAERNPWYSPK